MVRSDILSEIKRVGARLGLKEGVDYHVETGQLFDVEVIGREWQSLPVGMISRSAELFSAFLEKQPEWILTDADRSGTYFDYGGASIRFC